MADDPIIREFHRRCGVWAERTMEGLWVVGEHVLGESSRMAPVDEGTLRASPVLVAIVNGTEYDSLGAAKRAAKAAGATGTMPELDVMITYDLPYAAAQHEGIGFRHPLGGQAKYLEQPLGAAASRLATIMELTTQASLS